MLLLSRRPQAALLQRTTSSRNCFRTAFPAPESVKASQSMSVISTQPPQPGSHTDKVTGCILAALCGDALGAAVEGWTAHRIQNTFPNGLTQFQECRMGRGCYTGALAAAHQAVIVCHYHKHTLDALSASAGDRFAMWKLEPASFTPTYISL